MILKNWINFMTKGYKSRIYYTNGSSNVNMIDTFTVNSIACTDYANDGYSPSGSSKTYWGIAIGSDNTPPTIGDIKINTPIVSGIDASIHSNTLVIDSYNTTSISFTQTVRNTSAENITVNEIGVFVGAYNSGLKQRYLFSRDVIPTVTIAPDETKIFVVNFDFAQMNTTASVS